MKNFLKNFLITFAVLLLIASVLSMVKSSESKQQENIGIGQLISLINEGKVKKISIQGDEVQAELKAENSKLQIIKKEAGESFGDIMKNYGIKDEIRNGLDIEVKDESSVKFWAINLLPILIPLIIFIAFVYLMSRGVQGMNNRAMGFGKSTAKQENPKDKNEKKTFKDVAGMNESKEEMEEIVSFLQEPKKFDAMGAKIPKGVLLMGAPGTGKTLLAKAVAGEASVQFFHISGSEFVEMFVGVGASRVRDLFSKAKKTAPAIVFIDEIDAVGRKRGSGLGGGHDEREQTLNQILVEMDGFEPNLGVIVIAATNRPDVLDPALLRPGRFDRRITLDMPDIKEREAILKIHAKNKPISQSVNLQNIAERTSGFSGADLENLLNEAAILAVRNNQSKIKEKDILESIEKVLLGPERKSRILSEKDKKMTAYHEAGHAVVGYYSPHCDPVRKISIIGRGQAGGYTLNTPTEDKRYRTLNEFKDDLAMILGGYVVEKMIFGDISTGPSNDLRKATELARDMVTRYGMSKLGPRTFGKHEDMIFLGRDIHEQRDYSEYTAEEIDKAIIDFINEAKQKANDVINKNKNEMNKLVEVLLEKETIEQKEIKYILG